MGDGLALEGYEVVCLGDGRAALDHLDRGERPCLILLDLMMPIMDGRTFRDTMLDDPALVEIPVVVITAGGAQVAAGVPAEKILYKPLTIDEVDAVVHEHCGSPCVS